MEVCSKTGLLDDANSTHKQYQAPQKGFSSQQGMAAENTQLGREHVTHTQKAAWAITFCRPNSHMSRQAILRLKDTSNQFTNYMLLK